MSSPCVCRPCLRHGLVVQICSFSFCGDVAAGIGVWSVLEFVCVACPSV